MSLNSPRARRLFAGGLGLAVLAMLLTGCVTDGKEQIRFVFSKREAIDFMTTLVNDYNASNPDVKVILDTSGVDATTASFVRGNPPDIALANYNMETTNFVQRCALSDLSDTEAASRIREDLGTLMDQYGRCEGRTSALPYSIMSSAVIYNKAIFEQYDLEVPTTWSELIAVSETLQAAGVTPFYGTFKDPWTIGQGWYDYAIGGQIDVVEFFDGLKEEGTEVGPDSAVSFQKDQLAPVERMLELTSTYVNPDAAGKAYNDGNTAFAEGKAAMYLQGPWAINEIGKIAPDLEVGTFPLPMTEDPEDLKVRVNVDLAAWIPEGSEHKEAAREFLEYLYQPEVIDEYNAYQLGFAPTVDAADVTDPRVEGMVEYYDEGKVYQGSSVLVPRAIPLMNYAQAIVLGADPAKMLATIDADWARLAMRQ